MNTFSFLTMLQYFPTETLYSSVRILSHFHSGFLAGGRDKSRQRLWNRGVGCQTASTQTAEICSTATDPTIHIHTHTHFRVAVTGGKRLWVGSVSLQETPPPPSCLNPAVRGPAGWEATQAMAPRVSPLLRLRGPGPETCIRPALPVLDPNHSWTAWGHSRP